MTGPFLPTSELVAKHWLLGAVDGLADNVATTLPDVPWPNNEFIQIINVGGTPDQDVPRLNPVVSVSCFAAPVPGKTSIKPGWNRAGDLAMRVWQACFRIRYAPDPAVAIVLPDNFVDALVTSVSPVSDIRKIPGDPSQYAGFSLDLLFTWTPVGLVTI